MRICDIHSHILPGIDDGAKNWEETLAMMTQSYEAGVRRIIATPHYLPWEEGAQPEQIRTLCQEAQKRFFERTDHQIVMYPGQELYYHVDLPDKIRNKEVLTLADGRYALVEFDPEESFSTILQAVEDTRCAGAELVVAHAERYKCLRKEANLEQLLSREVKLQMNIGALQKGFFDETGRWCKKQLKKQRISFLATDMHHMHSRTPYTKEKLEWVVNNLSESAQEDLLWRNSRMWIFKKN